MNALQWKPSFSIGIPSVDHEHQQMITLINQAQEGLKNRTDPVGIEAMLGEIHAGIAAHFALEERLMRAAGYAEYEQHKADHEHLLEQIMGMMDAYVLNISEGERQLEEQLSDWFGKHFSSFDARLHGALLKPGRAG